jgi:hypothetical protein
LGAFWRVLQWKMLVYFMDIWSILRPFDIFYGHLVVCNLVYFPPFWYTYCTKKSGNPDYQLCVSVLSSFLFLDTRPLIQASAIDKFIWHTTRAAMLWSQLSAIFLHCLPQTFSFFGKQCYYYVLCLHFCIYSRVTRWVSEKIAQNVAETIFCWNEEIRFTLKKKVAQNLAYIHTRCLV